MSKQFDELSNFILNEMRMSHIYQPVMLIELLGRQGSASTTEIEKRSWDMMCLKLNTMSTSLRTWSVRFSRKVEASLLKTKTNIH